MRCTVFVHRGGVEVEPRRWTWRRSRHEHTSMRTPARAATSTSTRERKRVPNDRRATVRNVIYGEEAIAQPCALWALWVRHLWCAPLRGATPVAPADRKVSSVSSVDARERAKAKTNGKAKA
eukprot:4120839-Prymnesium_polylepis.1